MKFLAVLLTFFFASKVVMACRDRTPRLPTEIEVFNMTGRCRPERLRMIAACGCLRFDNRGVVNGVLNDGCISLFGSEAAIRRICSGPTRRRFPARKTLVQLSIASNECFRNNPPPGEDLQPVMPSTPPRRINRRTVDFSLGKCVRCLNCLRLGFCIDTAAV